MSKTIEAYRLIGKDLYNKLRLLTFPIAIKFIKDHDEKPCNLFRIFEFYIIYLTKRRHIIINYNANNKIKKLVN